MSVWNTLSTESQLEELREASFHKVQLIFKHSVRCGTSAHVRYHLEEAAADLVGQLNLHYLDLIRYRLVSDAVAATFDVPHQSPQVLVIKNGDVIYHASHQAIRPEAILKQAA